MMEKKMERKRNADQVLQGIRIVLPGTQALMGFQFIAFFNSVFQELPQSLQILHFVTLLLTIICSILLIAPVAFQQMAENGEVTERFLRYSRKMLATAMLFLLAAITGDIYLATQLIGIDTAPAIAITAFIGAAGLFFWFIYVFIRRRS